MGLNPDEIKRSFDDARNQKDFDQLQMEMAVANGQLNAEQLTNQTRFLQSGASIRQSTAEKRKQTNSTTDFLRLMNMMDNAMAMAERPLIDQFGEDYINVMAEALLSEEERAQCANEDELRQMMIDKVLDENGNVRPEYANKIEAQWVPELVGVEKIHQVAQEVQTNGYISEANQKVIDEVLEDNNLQAKLQLHENMDDITVKSEAVLSSDNDYMREHTESKPDGIEDLSFG